MICLNSLPFEHKEFVFCVLEKMQYRLEYRVSVTCRKQKILIYITKVKDNILSKSRAHKSLVELSEASKL